MPGWSGNAPGFPFITRGRCTSNNQTGKRFLYCLTSGNSGDERLHVRNKAVSEVIGRAYCLRRGKVVLVVETEAASGLSRIRMGGVTSDLWTPTKNLSTRPLRNTVGIIETPDMAGILPISSATPRPGTSAKPATSPSPTATPRR